MKWRIFFRRNPVRRPRLLVRNILYYVILPSLGILDRPTARLIRDDVRYIKKPYSRSDRRAIRDFYFHTSRHRLQLRLLRFYHLQERCESWARNGFLKGLEYRYPLLDRRIVEYMLRVPSELLCVTGSFRPLLREIGKEILPEEVRLHEQKNDPVCWEAVEALTKELSGTLIREVNDWEKIPEMSVVNFDLLKNDIAEYKTKPQKVKSKLLFDTLVYLKGAKEFIAGYNAPLFR